MYLKVKFKHSNMNEKRTVEESINKKKEKKTAKAECTNVIEPQK